VSAAEHPAQGLGPLILGNPESPVLELRPGPGPLADAQVDVVSAWRTVRLGSDGVRLMHDWTGRYLAGEPAGEPELWTASGIAQEEDVGRRTVYLWIERDDFPEPFAHPVGGAAVWEADRVRAWVAERRAYRAGGAGRPLKS
jgi:predicted DNA-binding transcriptional regulator AlpA